jgi:hypothetical protein
MNQSYREFLNSRAQLENQHGFDPLWIHDGLFDFQKALVEWAIIKGRGAIFADCGLGKTPIQLVWAENIVRKTNKPVLILTPLAVSGQTVREGEKFGVECHRSRDGSLPGKIVVTNYERLHYFNPSDFVGCVCDESSILKNFDGKTRDAVTEFMRRLPYRLLCTATAAPNDYIELGTSSEALGEMGHIDMLHKFFKSNDNSYAQGGRGGHQAGRWSKDPFGGKFRFRGHAERDFWRWVVSWARAVRKPSDMGFNDGPFTLPPLEMKEYVIKAARTRDGWLFDVPAVGLQEQREERRRTLTERCEKAAELVSDTGEAAVMWCHLNDEGDLLSKLVPDAVQIAGKDTDEKKEEVFTAFQNGEIRVLVTKPTIAGFGLNWQHCAHQTFFPSHSFEQWYQGIRRSWRFGQDKPVKIDVVSSEGEAGVLRNMKRKSDAVDKMFARLVSLMNNELKIQKSNLYTKQEEVPEWLLRNRSSQTIMPSITATA